METNIQPYRWRDNGEQTPGVLVRNDRRNYLLISMTDLIDVANGLVDVVEQHERQSD